ncbi:hypothetical protein BCR33DRAFT_792064 [Rhizoclosmatium globosum]|uniref:polynucleotide adenylyltransferase n=1 Tax=Rhizoclosmatium globosum TaxID=329046 RepID=A0A1Y2BAA4_9FUNG|nr:hypothetical protein BCR33DRAFT_792064 [Rhizoclosmatium globosum]|eukprot:ORY31743.1 hypothetical protein BCR33DRAFT_792064 [Rhizoclosmatium globosum]
MQSQNRRPLSYSAVVALTPPTPPSASTTTSTSNASSSDGSAVQGHGGSEDQSTTSTTTTSHQTTNAKEIHGNNLKHKQSIQRLIKSGLDHSEEEAESGAQEPTHPLSPSPSPSPSPKTTTQHHTNNQQHSHKRAPRDVSLKVKPSGQLRFNIEKLDQEDLEAVSGLVSFDSPTPIRTYPMHLPPLVEQQLDKELRSYGLGSERYEGVASVWSGVSVKFGYECEGWKRNGPLRKQACVTGVRAELDSIIGEEGWDIHNLQPREIDTQKRRDFVIKIQTLVGIEWPDRDIQVHAFGYVLFIFVREWSWIADSDVDLCFTTSWKDTQRGVSNMFVLAAFFKKYGMTRIYTVSKAKVPICKFYDPEFNLACDVNINNIIALRNTELIKSYVDMDDRVRPFIMVIKYWAKMRALNDAAKGGTLSSYCWVLMCLNFLQTRSPPILPSLQKPYLDQLFSKPTSPQTTRKTIPATIIDGVDCSFDRDAEPLSTRNTAGLADLVYTFFRHYAVEFSYPTSVVSTRHGAVLSKREKGWDVDVDRYCRWLCVEEVFGVERNLANSADGVAVAGLRGEMRRAVEGVLGKVLLPYYQQPRGWGSGGGSGSGNGYYRQRSQSASGWAPSVEGRNANVPHKRMNSANANANSNGGGNGNGGSVGWKGNAGVASAAVIGWVPVQQHLVPVMMDPQLYAVQQQQQHMMYVQHQQRQLSPHSRQKPKLDFSALDPPYLIDGPVVRNSTKRKTGTSTSSLTEQDIPSSSSSCSPTPSPSSSTSDLEDELVHLEISEPQTMEGRWVSWLASPTLASPLAPPPISPSCKPVMVAGTGVAGEPICFSSPVQRYWSPTSPSVKSGLQPPLVYSGWSIGQPLLPDSVAVPVASGLVGAGVESERLDVQNGKVGRNNTEKKGKGLMTV